MRIPSKQAFTEAKRHAKESGKPVILGWHIFQNLKSPAEISTPRYGRADQKSTRWYRKNFREAWVVMPDGTGYDVFDLAQPQCV